MHAKLVAMSVAATVCWCVISLASNAAGASVNSATIDQAYAFYQAGNLARRNPS